MRRTWGLATAAVLAAGTLGVQAGQTTGATASAADPAPSALTARPVADPGRAASRALGALQDHPGAARASRGQAFVAGAALAEVDGSTHVRLDRTYRGLPVLGGDLVVHQGPGGAWEGVSQTLGAPLDLGVSPTVSAAAAAARAVAASPATRTVEGLRAAAAAPELVVDAVAGPARLAWQVRTRGRHADGTPSRLSTYVDARSGEVLRREEHVQTVDGSGASLYSGTVPLQLTLSGSTYQLKDPTRGGTSTTDMANKQDSSLCQLLGTCKTGTLFTSTDSRFGTGSTSSRESAAVDAQYGTDETWDYYRQVHGRDGIFGDGRGSLNRVHYGRSYANAFWDGTKMTYGDGDGSRFGPLVSLDVAGHEMSHGVTQNTAALTYSGESGGLNEATSDIFGTMVEFFAANPADPGDYLIGEEFDLTRHAGFRRMDDPISDGSSPNCHSAATKNLDVHYSSGVGNHFFYLLAEGSGAKTINGVAHSSTTCDGTTVAGIGRDAAQRIWFRGLTVYMTSGTTYAGARTATLDAARDLYGSGSTQQTRVAQAWSAVGVG